MSVNYQRLAILTDKKQGVHYVTRRTKPAGTLSLLHLPAGRGRCSSDSASSEAIRLARGALGENQGGQEVSRLKKQLLILRGELRGTRKTK